MDYFYDFPKLIKDYKYAKNENYFTCFTHTY